MHECSNRLYMLLLDYLRPLHPSMGLLLPLQPRRQQQATQLLLLHQCQLQSRRLLSADSGLLTYWQQSTA